MDHDFKAIADTLPALSQFATFLRRFAVFEARRDRALTEVRVATARVIATLSPQGKIEYQRRMASSIFRRDLQR